MTNCGTPKISKNHLPKHSNQFCGRNMAASYFLSDDLYQKKTTGYKSCVHHTPRLLWPIHPKFLQVSFFWETSFHPYIAPISFTYRKFWRNLKLPKPIILQQLPPGARIAESSRNGNCPCLLSNAVDPNVMHQ